jgi:hypothetical protein
MSTALQLEMAEVGTVFMDLAEPAAVLVAAAVTLPDMAAEAGTQLVVRPVADPAESSSLKILGVMANE